MTRLQLSLRHCVFSVLIMRLVLSQPRHTNRWALPRRSWRLWTWRRALQQGSSPGSTCSLRQNRRPPPCRQVCLPRSVQWDSPQVCVDLLIPWDLCIVSVLLTSAPVFRLLFCFPRALVTSPALMLWSRPPSSLSLPHCTHACITPTSSMTSSTLFCGVCFTHPKCIFSLWLFLNRCCWKLSYFHRNDCTNFFPFIRKVVTLYVAW